MRLVIVCLLTTVTSAQTENGGIRDFHITVQRTKAYFEEGILRAFGGSKIPGTLKNERTLEDVAEIENGDLITLRDLELANDPGLVISSLNSTLDLFSTRLYIGFGDLVFYGKIYVNEDTKPAVDVRYTMTNVKGSGLVGLAVTCDGNFASTNYFLNYTEDHTKLETPREYQSLEKHQIDHLLFPERRLKREVHKVLNRLLKKRLDAALVGISANDVFGLEPSIVFEKEKNLRDFYDDIIDGVLDDLNNQVEQNGLAQISLPDFEAPFTYGIFGIDISGQVLGSEGWIRNLATFIRQGPVSLGYGSGNVIIFGSLGLTELRIGYEVCSVKVSGIGPSGHISGKIATNRADLALSINLRNQSITLANFEITELSDIDVEVTGLGPFNWLASKIAGRVITASKTHVVSTVEPMIKEQIDQALANLISRK